MMLSCSELKILRESNKPKEALTEWEKMKLNCIISIFLKVISI